MAPRQFDLECKNKPMPENRIATPRSLLDLSTEVLIEILAYLPAADMTAVQRTCRTIRDIVTGTAYLQYILLANINRVGDLLPPDFPYSERLELLRCHEQSLRDLQFNLFAECHDISGATGGRNITSFTLQDGYLIYECLPGLGGGLRYGYTDLCSAKRNKELRWVHLRTGEKHCIFSTRTEFAVDHDLVMTVSCEQDVDFSILVQLKLFEFSTGAPHPLARTHNVSLPPLSRFLDANVTTEVLGDHILITVWNRSFKAVVFLVSWKTGTVTLLRTLPAGPPYKGRRMTVSIDSSLVSLVDDHENKLEICKLELGPRPRLQTLCFLDLPPMVPGASRFFFGTMKEWVPTSKSYVRTRSSRGCHLPFYSSAVGTIVFGFKYYLPKGQCIDTSALIISVAALVSVIPTDARNVPWKNWGPSCTHFYKMARMRPMSLGPFWIADFRLVRQYDLRRTRYTQSMPGHKSSLRSHAWLPIDSITKLEYNIETHLPYRDVVVKDDVFKSKYVMANREWVVGVKSLSDGYSITVYHVG